MPQAHGIEAVAERAKANSHESLEQINLQRLRLAYDNVNRQFHHPNNPEAHSRQINSGDFYTVDIPVTMDQYPDFDIVFSVGEDIQNRTDKFIGIFFYKKGQKKDPVAQMSYVLTPRNLQVYDVETTLFEDLWPVNEHFGDHVTDIVEYLDAMSNYRD